MKKQNKKIYGEIIIFLIAGSLIQYYFLQKFSIGVDILASIITFLSVVVGFYITSFAIFSTSRYIAKLYKTVDVQDTTQTLMHNLIFKYKMGIITTLFSILYFVILILFITQNHDKCMTLDNKFLYPIISIFLFNFYYGYKMFNILVQIIIQESKNNGDK